ncbi:hypothetical protein HYPSUDRAFT_398545 [Hypholoma sublateritium FD-334 SS-4]|uniref:Uncharacterized protein n=1 Tax=Hypholoma sublateritium (strain FD-334 SS-4) TaxID=945553 RepID=A0A0D2NER1_HYPSF|nr:hypothetical protein HYPSUDRAFT_398545 [Hypholoma sublateritium FD-334 SS-4]
MQGVLGSSSRQAHVFAVCVFRGGRAGGAAGVGTMGGTGTHLCVFSCWFIFLTSLYCPANPRSFAHTSPPRAIVPHLATSRNVGSPPMYVGWATRRWRCSLSQGAAALSMRPTGMESLCVGAPCGAQHRKARFRLVCSVTVTTYLAWRSDCHLRSPYGCTPLPPCSQFTMIAGRQNREFRSSCMEYGRVFGVEEITQQF